jgi:hypothetical protein
MANLLDVFADAELKRSLLAHNVFLDSLSDSALLPT